MQEDGSRRSNETRTAEMRGRLLGAARELFVEKGYAQTSTPEVVKAAAVTRGALYHHFRDKADLFQAVVEAEAEAVADAIRKGSRGAKSAIGQLQDGATAYFRAMAAPGRARLLLIEGPAVLGREAMARVDASAGGATLRQGLEAALPPSAHQGLELGPLADILSAAFDRAALAIAEGAAPRGYESAIVLLLSRLTAAGDQTPRSSA